MQLSILELKETQGTVLSVLFSGELSDNSDTYAGQAACLPDGSAFFQQQFQHPIAFVRRKGLKRGREHREPSPVFLLFTSSVVSNRPLCSHLLING